jgi:hypothetical protein
VDDAFGGAPGSNKAAGDHFDELELNTHPALRPMQVTDEPRPGLRTLAERLHAIYGVELSEDELMESPHVFIGSVDQLERKCVELRDRSASPMSW